MRKKLSQPGPSKLMMRILMAAVSLVVALGLLLLLYPFMHDSALIYAVSQPGAGSPREQGLLASRVTDSAITRWRLERRLGRDDENAFRGAALVLNIANLLDIPGRDPAILDRYHTIQFADTQSDGAREMLMHMACKVDRDNPHRRRLAELAAQDSAAGVRQLAALLAAKLGQTDVLVTLMTDEEPAVRAKAYMDAGIIGAGDILLASTSDPDPNAFAYQAWALAEATGQLHNDLPQWIDAYMALPEPTEEQVNLLNRFIYAASQAETDTARVYFAHVISRYERHDQPIPAMLLLAGAELGLDQIGENVRDVLAAVRPGESVPLATLAAAIGAADRMELPVRKELYAALDLIWGEDYQHVCLDGALALGRQADLDQDGRSDPSRNACVKLLQNMATWGYYEPPAEDELGPGRVVSTPFASAGAVLALWRLEAPLREFYVGHAATTKFTVPGDYLAWHIGRETPEAGLVVGQLMLPPLGAPIGQRIYNENERAAGAMMLALSARTDEECRQVIDRITERLHGTTMGGEDNYRVRCIYKCALHLAGDTQYHEELRTMLTILELPQRPLLTALLGTGDQSALDWMLWNRQFNDADVFQLLLGQRLCDVLEVVAPELPALDRAAPNTVRMFQVQALRDTYVIRRSSIRMVPLR